MDKIIENLLEFDIIEDFFFICQKCRVSIYCLTSLKSIIDTHISLEDFDQIIINKIYDDYRNILDKYNNLENKLNSNMDSNEKIDYLLSYLNLQSQSDYLQIDILEYLCKIKEKMCEVLSNEHKKLILIYVQYKHGDGSVVLLKS